MSGKAQAGWSSGVIRATVGVAAGLIFLSTTMQAVPALSQEEVPPYAEGPEVTLIGLINEARRQAGVWPLQRSPLLTQAARRHSEDMIENDFVSSEGSDGSWPWDRAEREGFIPYPWGNAYVGESLAVGYPSAQAAFEALMADPGNRDNLRKSEYREIGVGYAAGGSWGHYWVIDLGAQPGVLPGFLGEGMPVTYSSDTTVLLTDETVPGAVEDWGAFGPAEEFQVASTPDFEEALWRPWQPSVEWSLACDLPWGVVHIRYRDPDAEMVTSQDRILCALRAGGGFSDVSTDHWFYDTVMLLYRTGVVNGFGDGTFRPGASVTRAEAATLIVRGFNWPLISPSQPTFLDLPRTHWAYAYVETARQHWVVMGYDDGTFRPEDPVKRAELVAMVIRAGGWPPLMREEPTFTDVPADFWGYGYVESASAHSLIAGYGDGTFRPLNKTSRAEAATVVARLLLLQVDATPEMLGYETQLAGLQGEGQVVPPTLPQKAW